MQNMLDNKHTPNLPEEKFGIKLPFIIDSPRTCKMKEEAAIVLLINQKEIFGFFYV